MDTFKPSWCRSLCWHWVCIILVVVHDNYSWHMHSSQYVYQTQDTVFKNREKILRMKKCGDSNTTASSTKGSKWTQDSLLSVPQDFSTRKHGNVCTTTSADRSTKQPCHQATLNTQPVASVSSDTALTQADIPRITEAVLTNLSTPPQLPPASKTE